jgi:hypothetical protein
VDLQQGYKEFFPLLLCFGCHVAVICLPQHCGRRLPIKASHMEHHCAPPMCRAANPQYNTHDKSTPNTNIILGEWPHPLVHSLLAVGFEASVGTLDMGTQPYLIKTL